MAPYEQHNSLATSGSPVEAAGTQLSGAGMTIMAFSLACILILVVRCYHKVLSKSPDSRDQP